MSDTPLFQTADQVKDASGLNIDDKLHPCQRKPKCPYDGRTALHLCQKCAEDVQLFGKNTMPARTLFRMYLISNIIRNVKDKRFYNEEDSPKFSKDGVGEEYTYKLVFPCGCEYSSIGVKDAPDNTKFCENHEKGYIDAPLDLSKDEV